MASSDVVVGGKSKCSLKLENGAAVFEGRVRLNPVGTTKDRAYCAIRGEIPRVKQDLSDFIGLAVKIKADEHTYALNVKVGWVGLGWLGVLVLLASLVESNWIWDVEGHTT